MTLIADLFMLGGGLVALLAGVGVLRFGTPYARFHAAGKASPIAFLVAAIGAGMHLGLDGGAYLLIAAVAMTITLPLGVHLLFRAVHRTTSGDHLIVDDLATAKAAETDER
ncbi:MAG: monovalent cation/H(+) antiporter subunit G [Actinomycetota bacterium]